MSLHPWKESRIKSKHPKSLGHDGSRSPGVSYFSLRAIFLLLLGGGQGMDLRHPKEKVAGSQSPQQAGPVSPPQKNHEGFELFEPAKLLEFPSLENLST